MLLQLLFISAVTMTTVVTSNFCPSFAPFYSDYGYALVDHVIKTLLLFKPDCMSVCQETLTCFSINIYKHQNGSLMCDLNRSNKKQRPGSFVLKTGYEYAEAKNMPYCVKGNCPLKDALPGNMFRFNSSIFTFIFSRKTWTDARLHCQVLGGDLASFSSEIELKFVFESMSHLVFILVAPIRQLLMNGDDKELSLKNGARIGKKDSMQALYLDGKKGGMYATTPRFDIHNINFTFGVWVKLPKYGQEMYILSDYKKHDEAFKFYIKDKLMKIDFSNHAEKEQKFKTSEKVADNHWIHVSFTWQRDKGQVKYYFDGILIDTDIHVTDDPNKDLHQSSQTEYSIGHNGELDKHFYGWMRDMIIIPQVLSQQEMVFLKDGAVIEGAWIGLNDIEAENQIKWSDGTPLTYQPNNDLSNTDDKDCGYINGSSYRRKWNMISCSEKLPFFCEIPIV